MPNLGTILFIAVVLTVLVGGHRYLWVRLVRDTALPPRARRWATGAIWALALGLVVSLFVVRHLPREDAFPLAFAAYSWFGIFVTLCFLLLFTDAPRLLHWVAGRLRLLPRRSEAPTDPDRRAFIRRVTAGAVTVAGAGLYGLGVRNALADVEVHRLGVRLERLPKALDGFRIVQLTDVHIGPMIDGRFLEGVVEKANAERPDLVVITGDLVDGSPALIGDDVARLRGLRARYGTWFITGNHEYYSGAPEWIRFLDGLGIETLTNRRVVIGDKGPGGASFDLAGIPDRTGVRFVPEHRPDLAATLAGRDPDRELVLLAHRPNPIAEAADLGVGLQLSGHTHGGQFFPVPLLAPLVHPYVQGLHRHGDHTQIYVSPGTGYWGPPMRTMTAAEVTSLTLTAG